MTRLNIREYKQDDKNSVVSLLKKGLTAEFTVERWNWLHHNEVTLGSDIVVGEFEGKIVGVIGAIKKRFIFNDQLFVGGRHVDPVVDTSMRGKGVFTKLLYALNELSDDVHFSYTFPNAASFKGFAKTGYTSIGPILMPCCQLKFMGSPMKEKARYFKTGFKVPKKPKNDIKKIHFDHLKHLAPRAPKDKYTLQRDYAYLNWRYKESPVKKYELFVHQLTNEIANACIILNDEYTVYIMDYVEYTEKIDMADYLSAIKNNYGKKKIVAWDNNLPDINDYFFGKSQQNFLVREGKLKMPDEFYNRQNWFVTRGEVEGN